ncbi:4Fe-4S binding protein [Pectinatus brassicae]|uniref:Epoxyqueuosine reductase QueG n=1 Tax=Pectinatus brassicae TaxID=862415 RepID=A0A840UEV3_9FIRM|nr:4Fe-4S binding protein [Pectinatus brassicae]MBB5336251.1 epoxyqueuosine reductase QueG [Pectinatus brassicae]
MNKMDIMSLAETFVNSSKDNIMMQERANVHQLSEPKIFEEPLCGISAATDSLYYELKNETGIGEHFLLPQQWLPQAKSVISFFLPFTEQVRISNRKDKIQPSQEWLYGRVEGQEFIKKFIIHIQQKIQQTGYKAIVPAMDEKFWSKSKYDSATAHPDNSFTSNWSERHVAFVSGLGTFGLSKGIITEKGMAGRLASLVTDMELAPDIRLYKEIYEYCTECGACVKRCPVSAISLAQGKNHDICSSFLNSTKEKYAPRYGCGKCQTAVPCENKIPYV